MERLTKPERLAIRGAAEGETPAETAERTDRAPEKVKADRKSAIAKLGASNLTHAVALACMVGIVKSVPAEGGRVAAQREGAGDEVSRDHLSRADLP